MVVIDHNERCYVNDVLGTILHEVYTATDHNDGTVDLLRSHLITVRDQAALLVGYIDEHSP